MCRTKFWVVKKVLCIIILKSIIALASLNANGNDNADVDFYFVFKIDIDSHYCIPGNSVIEILSKDRMQNDITQFYTYIKQKGQTDTSEGKVVEKRKGKKI